MNNNKNRHKINDIWQHEFRCMEHTSNFDQLDYPLLLWFLCTVKHQWNTVYGTVHQNLIIFVLVLL